MFVLCTCRDLILYEMMKSIISEVDPRLFQDSGHAFQDSGHASIVHIVRRCRAFQSDEKAKCEEESDQK